jgi:hypothetical protein
VRGAVPMTDMGVSARGGTRDAGHEAGADAGAAQVSEPRPDATFCLDVWVLGLSYFLSNRLMEEIHIINA